MKRLFLLVALCAFIVSCARNTPKVLIFIRNGSGQLEYMLKTEVFVMKDTLERSGIKVVIATLDGSSLSAGSIRLKTDLKLEDVKVDDYAGFIFPCMAAGIMAENPTISTESVELVKKAVSAGKPVAAQTGSIAALAQAGVLKGKKYAHLVEIKHPLFKSAIYSGTDVVRDGLVITSGICPNMARALKTSDGSEQLTLALIAAIREKK